MAKSLSIALFDTNFGERKQMERLLDRESDRRGETCSIYTTTFGNKDTLLNTQRIYDAYFLDLPDEQYSAYDLAKDLRLKDIASPIIFLCSSMNYRECGKELSNTFFMDKPVFVADLTAMTEELLQQKAENYVPAIEIRDIAKTHYLTEREIVYCENIKHTRNITIHLQDGGTMFTENDIDNLLSELEPLGQFFMANNQIIVNARYVDKTTFFRIYLKNGKSFKRSYLT